MGTHSCSRGREGKSHGCSWILENCLVKLRRHFFVTCNNPEIYNALQCYRGDSNKVWLFVTRSTLSVMSHIITNIFHSIWQVEKAFVCVHAPHWTALVCALDRGRQTNICGCYHWPQCTVHDNTTRAQRLTHSNTRVCLPSTLVKVGLHRWFW